MVDLEALLRQKVATLAIRVKKMSDRVGFGIKMTCKSIFNEDYILHQFKNISAQLLHALYRV